MLLNALGCRAVPPAPQQKQLFSPCVNSAKVQKSCSTKWRLCCGVITWQRRQLEMSNNCRGSEGAVRGPSFFFLLSRSGHPSTNDRMVRSSLRSLYPLSGPCSSGSFLCSLVISVVSCLSSFALAFPYYCFRKALSERLAGSLKLLRYHQPFPFLSRQQRRGGVEFWSAFGRCLFWLSDGCIPAWGSHECHWCAMV